MSGANVPPNGGYPQNFPIPNGYQQPRQGGPAQQTPYGGAQPQKGQTPYQMSQFAGQQGVTDPVSLQLRAIFQSGGLKVLFYTIGIIFLVPLVFSLLIFIGSLIGGEPILPLLFASKNFLSVLVGIGGLLAGSVMGAGASNFSLPLGVYALIIFLIYKFVKPLIAHDGSTKEIAPLIIRGFVESLIASMVVVICTVFWGVNHVRANGFLVFLFVFITVFVVLFSLRSNFHAGSQVTVVRDYFNRAVREINTAFFMLFAVFTIPTLILLAIPYFGHISDYKGAPLFAIAYLPNAVMTVMGLAFFGGLEIGHSVLFAWNIYHGSGALLFLVAIIAIVFAAAAVGVRRAPSASPIWARVWQLPAASFISWLVLFLLFGEFHAGRYSAGIAPWALFMPFIACIIISVLAEFLPRTIASFSLNFLAFIAGKRATTAWMNTPVVSASPRQQAAAPVQQVPPQAGYGQQPPVPSPQPQGGYGDGYAFTGQIPPVQQVPPQAGYGQQPPVPSPQPQGGYGDGYAFTGQIPPVQQVPPVPPVPSQPESLDEPPQN